LQGQLNFLDLMNERNNSMRLKEKYKTPTDLHAHTVYSDGIYSIEKSLLKRQDIAKVLGVSDHYHYLSEDRWEEYIKEINYYKNKFNDHTILVGLEIIFSDLKEYIHNIRFKDLDYLIIEDFETISLVENFETVIDSLISKFSGDIIMAHPNFPTWKLILGEKRLFQVLTYLRDNEIAIEINVNQGYFHGIGDDFSELMSDEDNIYVQLLNKTDSLLSIGTDAHGYEDVLFSRFKMTYDFLQGGINV